MAAEVKHYDCKVVQTALEYDNFLYIATLHPEYDRQGMELATTGRYHVILLWPLGTVHFIVYKDDEKTKWDIDEVEEAEEEAYATPTGDKSSEEEETVNPLSLEAIIPDAIIENIGSKIESEYL